MKMENGTKSLKSLFFTVFMLLVVFKCGILKAESQTYKTFPDTAVAKEKSKLVLRYVGTNTDGCLMSVKYNNPLKTNLFMSVTDADGEVLYESGFNDATLSKTLLFPRPFDVSKLVIAIKDADGYNISSKELSIKTTLVDNVVVSIY